MNSQSYSAGLPMGRQPRMAAHGPLVVPAVVVRTRQSSGHSHDSVVLAGCRREPGVVDHDVECDALATESRGLPDDRVCHVLALREVEYPPRFLTEPIRTLPAHSRRAQRLYPLPTCHSGTTGSWARGGAGPVRSSRQRDSVHVSVFVPGNWRHVCLTSSSVLRSRPGE